ncbi:PEPxxWA-CTERM sorting domain-containing protein [Sandarakinorhabdus sp.]|uniref:PEPxxWA-CTERM sorting domain-containing protein n=1 Tax=Sandarakinorhabdus sp. TaxID=1916663 RepID=UPI003F702D46
MRTTKSAMFAVALIAAAQAQAAAQIDVDNLIVGQPSTGRLVSTAFAGGMMQTWTAGTTGRLTQIDMFTMAYYNGDPPPDPSERAVLEIYDAGSFGSADYEQNIAAATLLGSASLPLNGRPNGSQISAVQTFILSSLNIDVQQNQRLAFRMLGQCSPCSANASYWVNWTSLEGAPFINSNGYAGGGHFNPVGAPGLYGATGADLNFRTWVDPSAAGAIPEPASWAMLIAGFGLTGAMARRRRMLRAVTA